MKTNTTKVATKNVNLVAIAKKATNEANKVKRVEEVATINNVRIDLTNCLQAYKSEVLSLNARCRALIEAGKISLHHDKPTKTGEVIGLLKKHFPYIFENGKFAKMSVVYRENGTKYLQFTEVENISDKAIVSVYISHLNSQSMYSKDKVRKQLVVVEFMSVDKKELAEAEYLQLITDRDNLKLYSFDPTPEAVAKVAKEKADKYAKEYAAAVEAKQANAEKVVYIAE